MDTTRGLKEKPRFASPVARSGQNEGERKNQIQKEEMIKKTKEREEKEGPEGERESFHASGKKEFETGEVLECSEKSEIGKGNRSTGVEPKQTKILKSEKKNLSAKEVKGGKFTKAKRKRTIGCVAPDENLEAEDAESGVVQGDGGGVAECREQEADTGNLLEEKKPMLSGGAQSSTSVGKKSKTKKKDLGVEVQEEEGIKKNKSKSMRAEGGDKEKRRGNSVESKQKASQGATTGLGKARVQSVIKSQEPQPISSLLSDSQYNEIFESVLDSSLEHCLEDARAVLSEVELLQASIGKSCESSAIGGNWEGELESSQSGRSSRGTGQGKKGKLQEKSVEKTSGEQTEECEQEPKKSNCNGDEYDLWAQCSRNSCKKWRKLKWQEDLSVLPADWACSQNTDPQHSSCDCPEENWSGSEEDLVHSSLVPGSMVWAQQPGFPWWPAMIESDPDAKSSFLFKNKTEKSPSKYHVTYFGEPATRAWVSACRVKAFHALSEEAASSMVRQQSYKKMFSVSLNMSRQAEKLPLKRRLAKFGFLSRYQDSKVSVGDNSTESSEEYSCDEEDFAGTSKKRCKKGAKPEAKKKAAKLPSNQKQNGRNGPKLNSNKELGKKEKGKEEEKKKAANTLFPGPKEKKAASKPESAGEADSRGKELGAGGERAEKKVLTPSFTKPKDKKTTDKQALQVEKPQLKVREQTIPGITAPRGQEGGEGERGSESTGEDRKAGKIKEKDDGVKRDVEKEGSGEERKNKILPEVKREGSVTKEDRRGSATEGEMKEESEGEALEEECTKKTEKSAALEDLTGFLEDDMEILNCQQEFLNDVGTEEEEDGEEFNLMLFKGVRATYLPA
ncbi:zinc finger CW-type PWWP domain protein 1-like isoform X1 [Anguilla rostrata]|uniref:zinc finger CW-type PWWP domain protein 1-like isoform X1 n=1 Tax=Anguilla rostrata TaxID=7938 RepID=UPI0030D2BB7C